MPQAAVLDLLYRVAVAVNDTRSVKVGAQVCIDEVCDYAGWPTGNLFLVDETCKTRFLSTVIWPLSNSPRYRRFRKATEMYAHDPGNKFLNETRSTEARRAGLKRSFGFSVMADEKLAAVLEFSTDKAAPPKEIVLKTVALVGVQLGYVFERRRAAAARQRVSEYVRQQNKQIRTMSQNILTCTNRFLPALKTELEHLYAIANRADLQSGKGLADSVDLIERYVSDLSTIARSIIEFPQNRVRGARVA
jgi:hypothetical protein